MKWIKVEDKLPEEGQKVIYYFEYVGMHMGKFMKDENNIGLPYGNIFYSKSGFLTDDVTHWMPIPEKPQTEHSQDCEMVKHGYSDCTCGFDNE